MAAAAMAAVAVAGTIAALALEPHSVASAVQWAYALPLLAFPALGWLIASRRPDSAYGWVLLATADCLALGLVGAALLLRIGQGADVPGPLAAVLTAMLTLFYGLTWVFIPLLFPEGRLPSARWRPVAWLAAGGIALHWVGIVLIPEATMGQFPSGELGALDLLALGAAGFGQTLVFVLALVVLGSVIVRWRRSRASERRQLGWLIAGILTNLTGALLLVFVPPIGPDAAAVIGVISVVGALPATITVAFLRHNLLDIRVGLKGSRLYLVFDVRPTVDELLSGLGPALEDMEPVEQLGRLAAAVRTGLDTRWAAVSLSDGTRVVAGREEGRPALTVPAGLGHIDCGPKTAGRLTREDRRLLTALAVPVALAIQSAGLAARLVNAQEAERRRIERNIHDGVQQQLVALIAGLEMARATGGEPQVLNPLREQARQTLSDLRELAAGIHPAVLSQGGLVEAVEERCSRLPVATTVTADEGLRERRFPDEIEGAVYFTVSEAVANALKHASASAIRVRLSHASGRLAASVTDDGKGFDPGTVTRTGLAMLADRLSALGGGLEVTSGQEEGTLVHAWVKIHA
ncbi:hypothetical protein GCM10022226_11640 [Sphaerisporangium flaviroseum]|uniref:histidine kinase n=2 Tax=Sphaerisporangium flaviroseum TaxID=509199 RepID=A0ABP7HI46_9ACTN